MVLIRRIVCGPNKQTPLHILIKKINLDFIEGATEKIIERFLKYGLVNTSDADGFTPLHKAVSTDNFTAATYLISQGADVKAKTIQGLTPLHLAAARSPQMTKLLISAGAEVNALDEKGRSPLAYSEVCMGGVLINNNETYWHPPSNEGKELYREAQRELINISSYEVVKK